MSGTSRSRTSCRRMCPIPSCSRGSPRCRRATQTSTRAWLVTRSSRIPPCSCTGSSADRSRSMSAVNFANLPLGKQTTHGVEINLTRRFNKGFALSAAYSGNRIRNLEFVERVRPRAHPLAAERQRPSAPRHSQRPGRVAVRCRAGSSRARAFLARFSAAGRSAARSNTSLDRSSRGATSSSMAISRTSPSDDPTLDRWFNVDAGFERDPARVPANFQKRVFPFRIDGVRGPNLLQVNMNFMRTVTLPGRRCAELPRRHHQPPESDDVRQPESEPGEHRLRAHHERDSRFAAVHPVRLEVYVLEASRRHQGTGPCGRPHAPPICSNHPLVPGL